MRICNIQTDISEQLMAVFKFLILETRYTKDKDNMTDVSHCSWAVCVVTLLIESFLTLLFTNESFGMF